MSANWRTRSDQGIGLVVAAIAGGALGFFIGMVIGASVAPEGKPGHELETLFDSMAGGALIGLAVGAIGLPLFVSLMVSRSRRHAALSPLPRAPQPNEPPYWPPPPGWKRTSTEAAEHEHAVLAGSREPDT